ncbi:MAG: T9SS type A sorting domain-containing protein [Nonlabens sp.]|uniref:T9SS type A sorting domain-containing protein n=1 Tax=Nonlabens sp. TaxID=1888209 RepID=UPI003EF84695
MKRITFFIFLIAFLGQSQSPTDPLNVLFVGNSITYFNNLPQTFKAIAEEQGYSINLDQHTPGGTGFINHVNNATLYQKLDNTVWDYVILQPGSNESPAFSQPLASTIARAVVLRDKIYENSPCASIYLYEISYGIVDNTPASMQQYLQRQTLIKNNLMQMSDATSIPLAPVGEAFQTSIQQNPNHFLWNGYGDIHPNAKGSFIGACTFYNSIFQKPILNSAINLTFSVNDANLFRNVAQTVSLNDLDDWNIDTLVAHANFDVASINSTTASFTNTSTNYDTLLWNFGDGMTSTIANPTHAYDFTVQPEYNVYLTAFKGCKAHHFTRKVSQATLSNVTVASQQEIKVYPNPVTNYFTISATGDSIYKYQLYDTLGQEIRAVEVVSQNQVNVDMSDLSSGIYYLQVQVANQSYNYQMVKN